MNGISELQQRSPGKATVPYPDPFLEIVSLDLLGSVEKSQILEPGMPVVIMGSQTYTITLQNEPAGSTNGRKVSLGTMNLSGLESTISINLSPDQPLQVVKLGTGNGKPLASFIFKLTSDSEIIFEIRNPNNDLPSDTLPLKPAGLEA